MYREAYPIVDRRSRGICECCGEERVGQGNHDHTINQAECRRLGKTELMWDPDNISHSCNKCHAEWEAKKNPAWKKHLNADKRMLYLEKNDPEDWRFRKYLCD